MAKSKWDSANQAIRVFLEKVGRSYDQKRGFTPFLIDTNGKKNVLEFFGNRCCYCGRRLSYANAVMDHLIPMNRTSCGLHSWGNVVPSCATCNTKKAQKSWQKYLKTRSAMQQKSARSGILRFIRRYKYRPDIKRLSLIAEDLYEDVAEVTETLIKLRLERAEKVIKGL